MNTNKPTHTPCPEHSRFANSLAVAWEKYTAFFGRPPYGTTTQIAAMLELMPAKEYAAAPELMAALKVVLRDGCGGWDNMVRAAIAKAEGK